MTDSHTNQTPYDDADESFEGGFAFEQSAFGPQGEDSRFGCTDFADKPNGQTDHEYQDEAFNYKCDQSLDHSSHNSFKYIHNQKSLADLAELPFYEDAELQDLQNSEMHHTHEVQMQALTVRRGKNRDEQTIESNQVEQSQAPSTSYRSREVIQKKIMRYWLKKGKRITKKQIRYDCRQSLAKQRFRYQGRFITKAEMEQLDRDQIYDPNLKHQLPRAKRIFKISKDHHHFCKCKDRTNSPKETPAAESQGIVPSLFQEKKDCSENSMKHAPEEHQEHESTHSSEIRISKDSRLNLSTKQAQVIPDETTCLDKDQDQEEVDYLGQKQYPTTTTDSVENLSRLHTTDTVLEWTAVKVDSTPEFKRLTSIVDEEKPLENEKDFMEYFLSNPERA